MLFYTEEARESAIESIFNCMCKIGSVSGSELSYTDAATVNKYLSMLVSEIEKESKAQKEGK